MKKLVVGTVILIILVGTVYGYIQFDKAQKISQINSFEKCAEAGFPIMDSYPGRCATPDGRSFTQEIGNELDLSDEILVENPRPNQRVKSPLQIGGKARGPWYFEANFSAELFDASGKSLAVGIVQAQKEWMTEDFVPFEGKLIFSKPNTSKGKLILHNANPSGLSENAKKLIIPVEF